MKKNIKQFSLAELEAEMIQKGHRDFRARQLFRWLYQKRARSFAEMTDMSKAFREQLDALYSIPSVGTHTRQVSEDGTVKYLVQLGDGHTVESVFIPTEGRNTLCISTQVGCKMACTFCATGYQKFSRNLEAWEMVDQLLMLEHPAPVTNIVLMGMGEPLDNFGEVVRALEIFQNPMGPAIGKRHITISTVGLNPMIKKLAELNLGKIAVSLHGTTDAQRSEIMPINRKYPLDSLLQTCRELTFKGTQRVTFEYILLKDFNDSDEDARRLVKLMKNLPCKINLLAYNENPFINFKRPSEQRILSFQKILLDANLTTTYRRSRGRDIDAACGQLRSTKAAQINSSQAQHHVQ